MRINSINNAYNFKGTLRWNKAQIANQIERFYNQKDVQIKYLNKLKQEIEANTPEDSVFNLFYTTDIRVTGSFDNKSERHDRLGYIEITDLNNKKYTYQHLQLGDETFGDPDRAGLNYTKEEKIEASFSRLANRVINGNLQEYEPKALSIIDNLD